MATRKKIGQESGDNLGLIALSSLAGVVLATPSLEDQQKLQYLKDHEADFYSFQQHKFEFTDFKREKSVKFFRLASLGNITIDSSINNYTNALEIFQESVNLFGDKYYRSSTISAIITIESVLKEELGHKKFIELVNEAASTNLISQSDKSYLHGLRLDRNSTVHTLSGTISG